MSKQKPPQIRQTEEQFLAGLRRRTFRGRLWQRAFLFSSAVGLIALAVLLGHVVNQSAGMVIVRYTLDPEALSERSLAELDQGELLQILQEQQPNRLRVMIRDRLSRVPANQFTLVPLGVVLEGSELPDAWRDRLINDLSLDEQLQLLADNLSRDDIHDLVVDEVLRPRVIRTWSLIQTLTEREQIEALAAEQYPQDALIFRSWISSDFVSSSVSSSATTAGLRTALLGSA